MKALVIIPARKGSKGVPFKNKRILGNKSLIEYTIEAATAVFDKKWICVTTNDEDIIEIAGKHDVRPPFIRPEELATDTASSQDVIMHAVDFYEKQGFDFDTVVLLQATSPFRSAKHLTEALKLYHQGLDMLVSVCESKANPYYNLFEENEEGFLEKSKRGNFTRRQDCPQVFEYNGAIYIINKASLKAKKTGEFTKVMKYEMDSLHSHDIDTEYDWMIAEQLLKMKENGID